MYNDFVDWYETFRLPFIQEVTTYKYKRTAEIIKEKFGDIPTSEINRKALQKFFNELSQKYQKLTIKIHNDQMHAFFQSLVDDGELERNPMNNINFSGVEKEKKKKYLDVEEYEVLKESLDLTDKTELMIYVAMQTGMRYAEVLGITPADIYDKKGIKFININKTMDYKVNKGEFKTTKTKSSIREIAIDATLFDALSAWIVDKKVKEDEGLFGLNFSSVTNKKLTHICTVLDISIISFHGLRHTHGSILLRHGVPMLSVSKRLGHASMSITQDIYIHLTKEQEEEDNLEIINILGGS